MIEIKETTKKYGELTVIDKLSISFAKGTKTALMGGSGRGKTTLLRIIAGLESATLGSVKVNTPNIAYMFQESRLLPWKTAEENVKAVLDRAHFSLAEKYLSAVGLDGAKDKFPGELSGGMAQRVAFARFLAYAEATNAELLLLDEPFSALDTETATKMISLLHKASSGKTLIIVTHDAAQASEIADNVTYI